MKPAELVKTYYDTLKAKHYRPLEHWGRDCRCAKTFLSSGRTIEEFQILLNKALVGPKETQIAACQGLHRFMYLLPKIELMDSAPWEPSAEERAANVKILNAAAAEIESRLKAKSDIKWEKNPNGGWVKKGFGHE